MHVEVSSATIFSWLKEVVKYAYDHCVSDDSMSFYDVSSFETFGGLLQQHSLGRRHEICLLIPPD